MMTSTMRTSSSTLLFKLPLGRQLGFAVMLVAGFALLSLTACGGGDAASPETAQKAAPPASQSSANANPPAGTPPASGLGALSSRGGQVAQGAAPSAGRPDVGITFSLPEAWQEETPTSSMRYAQATIPGAAGNGELTVFYFGPGGGGGVDANLQRWAAQVEASEAPKQESFQSNGLAVHLLETDGTLKASTMGTGPTTDQPGFGLLGAVVEGPGGPWFFKMTGPSATLASQRDAFLEMLRGIEPSRGQA